MADIDKMLTKELSRRDIGTDVSSGKQDIDSMLQAELSRRQGSAQEGGPTIESQIKKQLPTSMREGAGGVATDMALAFPAAAIEVGRGAMSGAAGVYDALDAGATLISNLTGTTKGDAFGDWAANIRDLKSTVPPTEISGVPKAIYNLAGELPSIHLKYASAGKVLEGLGVAKFLGEKGLQGLNVVGEFALVEALDEYGKTEEYSSLASGALKGATIAAAFGSGAELFKIGTRLLWKAGRGATKKLIQAVTGDKQLAADFVKNPSKYNGDVIESGLLAEQDLVARSKIKNKYTKATRNLEDEIRNRNYVFKEKNAVATFELRSSQELAKESLKEGSKTRLTGVVKNANIALQNKSKVLKDGLFSTYDDVAQHYNLARKEYGEAVSQAIDTTVARDASKSINTSYVSKNFNKAISKGPFRRTRTINKVSVFSENVAGADVQQIKQLESIVQQYETLAKDGKVSVKYLQDLKNHTNDLATKYFKSGDTKLATMYSDMSKSVNPAKIVEGSKTLTKEFGDIAKANANYSEFMKSYDNAVKVYYTRDAQGKLIPDIDKGIRAVATNDRAALNVMNKADKVLPKESKMVPRLKQAHSDMLKFETEKDASISLIKKKINVDKVKLNKDMKQANRILNDNKNVLSNEQYAIEKQKIRNLHDKREAELEAFNEQIIRRNVIQDRTKKIKSAVAKDAAGLIQRALFYGGGATSIFPGAVGKASAPLLAGAVGLSPAVSQIPGKVFSKPTQAQLEAIIGDTVKSKLYHTLQEVAADKITNKKEK